MIFKKFYLQWLRAGCLLGLVLFGTASTNLKAQENRRDVAKLYEELCSACHGDNLEGGQTDSLLDDKWKHGGEDADLTKAIVDGFELNGMPPWKNLLSEQEVRALVVYIREKATQARMQQAQVAKPDEDQVVESQAHKFRLKTFVGGLETPWSLAFLPDGRMLVTELPGRLRIVENGRLLENPVSGTPRVLTAGQGGLMEVALHPDYAQNGWIYLAYSDPATNSPVKDTGLTGIVRGRIKNGHWTDQQIVFAAPQSLHRPGGVHFGCRLVFDGKGYLYFSIGERGHMQDAQDITRPNGKIHRIFDDGRIPADNPFAGHSNAFATIWTYGNRNPQGLDRDPATGDLWETEHGPRGGDELNLIQKGRNYGWPIITYGMNYDGTPLGESTARDGLEQPVIHWTPSIAVCGIDFYEGKRFPKWTGNLFVSALAQQELRRVVIKDRKVVEQELLFKGIGRVRDVASGPDGLVYVILNKPDKIVRLEPES